MLNSTTWALQIKSGNGDWIDLKTLTNSENSTDFPLDSNFVSQSVSIPTSFEGVDCSLRIVYRKSVGSYPYEED